MRIDKGSKVFIDDRQEDIVFDRVHIVLSDGALLQNCLSDRCTFEFYRGSTNIIFSDCDFLNCDPVNGNFVNCTFAK